MSRRIVDLPAPLAPRKILVCPVFRVKLMSRRITLSSKASLTWSKTTIGPPRAERLLEQGGAGSGLDDRHQYINTMSSCVTR